jgi:putrescine transport system ATP-binding protein
MEKGKLVQIGTPTEIYEFPRNRFVADFFGTINICEGSVSEANGQVTVIQSSEFGTDIKALPDTGISQGMKVWVAVRPEKISLSKDAPSGDNLTVLKGVVWDLGYYGNLSVYLVKTPSGKVIQVSAQNRVRSAQRVLEWDDEVFLYWEPQSSVVLTE